MKNSGKIVYEVFEEEKASFLPSYIMSIFVLGGLSLLIKSKIPLWPPTLVHVFFAIWFGCLFYWMIRNARDRSYFRSNRLTVTDEVLKHTFRNVVAEVPFVEIPIKAIEKIKVTREERATIEIFGGDEFDLYVLPRNADVDGLIAALKKVNPAIEVEE